MGRSGDPALPIPSHCVLPTSVALHTPFATVHRSYCFLYSALHGDARSGDLGVCDYLCSQL